MKVSQFRLCKMLELKHKQHEYSVVITVIINSHIVLELNDFLYVFRNSFVNKMIKACHWNTLFLIQIIIINSAHTY